MTDVVEKEVPVYTVSGLSERPSRELLEALDKMAKLAYAAALRGELKSEVADNTTPAGSVREEDQ